jgi:hypothetical protein
LAEGSKPGDYVVSLIDAFFKPVFSTNNSSSQGRILRAVVDTRGLPPGEYDLCVRRESDEEVLPDCVPILVQASRARIDKLR